MTKAKSDTASIELEQPRTGGSFTRQPDGSLQMVEGAIPPAGETPADPPAPDDGATDTDQNKG